MKKYRCLISLLLITILSSCEEKLEYYDLNVIVEKSLNVKEGSKMDADLTKLIGYYRDTICKSIVFVPNVKVWRVDNDEYTSEVIAVELSKLNTFRKSMDMLSTVLLTEDYDENLSKLAWTKIFISQSDGLVDLKKVSSEFGDVSSIVTLGDKKSMDDAFKQISNLVCKEGNRSINVILRGSNIGGTIPEDTSVVPCCDGADLSLLEQSLMKLRDFNVNSDHRIVLASKLYTEQFDPKASVSVSSSRSVAKKEYDAGHAIKYLNYLAVTNSILRVEVTEVKTSAASGKISGLNIVETHQ